MMEFGIRGFSSCPGNRRCRSTISRTTAMSCTDIWRTNIAAFQQLWFAWLGATRHMPARQNGMRTGPSTTQPSHRIAVLLDDGASERGLSVTPTYNVCRSSTRHDARMEDHGVAPWDDSDWGVPHVRGRRPLEQRHAREGARRLRRARTASSAPRARHERAEPERRLHGSARAVQHRRPSAEHEPHARALERDGGRHELGRRRGADERGRGGPLPDAAPRRRSR